ncbi:SPOR domain-containing protein [Mucilaginibacter terrae]|uniref:SPOR domain-containing protein n=1 Tax=Mucilaginibacter terrae TaxID=1955052 RepID=UPI003645F309
MKAGINRTSIKACRIIKALFACLLLCVLSKVSQAQTRGKLEIIKDPRIDSLIAHRTTAGKLNVGGGSGNAGGAISAYGYRVQFYSGSNRKDAFNAQNRFQQMHPDMRTYISYKEPNFKVKGGDFRSRLEATKLIQELKGIFSPLFVISEKINLPKLELNTNPQ